MKFDEIFFACNNETLKPLLGYLPIGSSKVTRKADMVALLREYLLTREGLQFQLDRLSPLEKQAVIEATFNPASPGRLDRVAFKAKHDQLPGRFNKRHAYDWGDERNPTRLALFLSRMYELPAEMLPLLRELLPEPPPYELPAQETLPDTVGGDRFGKLNAVPLMRAETEDAALHDLITLLRLIEEGKIKVGEKTGLPGTASMRLFNKQAVTRDFYETEDGVLYDDFIRPYGLIVMAQLTGLAHAKAGTLSLTPYGRDWLRSGSPEVLRAAFNRLTKTDGFDELRRINNIKGQQAGGQVLTPPSARRVAILEALKGCPVSRWVHIEDFFRWVKISGNNFEVEAGDFSYFYCFDQEYGHLQNVDADVYWRVVQGQYILAVLFEYLASFGAVDVAYVGATDDRYNVGEWLYGYDDADRFSRYDGLKYIRLTALGAFLLGLTDTYETRRELGEPILKVLPNQQIVLTHRQNIVPHDRAILARFCTRISEDVYRIASDQLLETLESGLMSAANIAEFLVSRSGAALPQTIEVMLTDVAERSGKIAAAGEAILFDVQDATFALMLAHDKVLKGICVQAGADKLVVRSDKVRVFHRRVRELGYGVRGLKG